MNYENIQLILTVGLQACKIVWVDSKEICERVGRSVEIGSHVTLKDIEGHRLIMLSVEIGRAHV